MTTNYSLSLFDHSITPVMEGLLALDLRDNEGKGEGALTIPKQGITNVPLRGKQGREAGVWTLEGSTDDRRVIGLVIHMNTPKPAVPGFAGGISITKVHDEPGRPPTTVTYFAIGKGRNA